MPTREQNPQSGSAIQPQIQIHTDSAYIRNTGATASIDDHIHKIHAPGRTLYPISSNAMNTLITAATTSHEHSHSSKKPSSTIRSVPPEALQIDGSPDIDRRTPSRSDPSNMPHATKTLSPILLSPNLPPLTRQNSIPMGNGIVRTISAEFGPTRSYPNNNIHTPEDSHVGSNPSSPGLSGGGPQWSSAVGRANLGKSGRVIERLMAENDMLKRDLTLERLRAEESKQVVKMAEGRLEAMAAEYEGRLHDAAVTKTLLKRRERQLAELKAQVEGEKQRADAAVDRERGWRDAMERTEEESKRQVEEAQTFATLMEGRNKAMTSHWKEQGAEVNRTVNKLGKEIETLVIDRRNDDDRMNMLQGLCDQQAEQLSTLQKEKESIYAAFESYKTEQEEGLKAIKERALAQERANEQTLDEAQKVLGELKWALAVKKNVKGA